MAVEDGGGRRARDEGERMATTIEATYDGQVFRPAGPVALPPNTTVRITVEPIPDQPSSFLRTARSLNLQGPPDWASRLEDYLDGGGAAGFARRPGTAPSID